MDSHMRAKSLLANYLNAHSKMNILNEDKIEILSQETSDAIIVNTL